MTKRSGLTEIVNFLAIRSQQVNNDKNSFVENLQKEVNSHKATLTLQINKKLGVLPYNNFQNMQNSRVVFKGLNLNS